MGGQRGQRAAGSETSSSGGSDVAPADYGSNEFMAAYLRATKSPKQRCEDRWNGGGLDVHTPMIDGFKLDANAGAWCTDDGEEAMGFDGNLSFHQHTLGLPGHEATVSGPNANAQFGWLGDHFAVGGQLNAGEAKYRSTDDYHAERDDDDEFGFGLSLGMGWALRAHNSDKDNDGRPEYGLGFDWGPASLDYKTETPVRDAVLFGLLGPVNAINWMFGDSVLESLGIGTGVDSLPAPELAEAMSASASPETFGPSTSTARETVPPKPAAPALPEGSVFAQPSPASFLQAPPSHPGSVFGR